MSLYTPTVLCYLHYQCHTSILEYKITTKKEKHKFKMKKLKFTTILFILFSIIFLTSCANKTKDSSTAYGISSPINSLSWGMSVDECKQKLTDYTFESIGSYSNIKYSLSPMVSILDYTDEIAQIILKFDSAITESYYPYHSDTLNSIQVIFTGIDIDKMKEKITDLVGTDGTYWVDVKKINFVTWESRDTIGNLDQSSYNLLDDFWTLLEKHSSVDLPFKIEKDKSESINKVVMHYTEENNCSVEFYGGINALLYNLKQVER